jgi:hypothetical protein
MSLIIENSDITREIKGGGRANGKENGRQEDRHGVKKLGSRSRKKRRKGTMEEG